MLFASLVVCQQDLDELLGQIFTQDNSGINQQNQIPNQNQNPNINNQAQGTIPTPVIVQGGGNGAGSDINGGNYQPSSPNDQFQNSNNQNQGSQQGGGLNQLGTNQQPSNYQPSNQQPTSYQPSNQPSSPANYPTSGVSVSIHSFYGQLMFLR